MCLAVPMQVVSKESESGTGVAEIGGVKRKISFMMLPEADVGAYVIVHAGFAIQLLNEDEALKRLELFREIAEFDRD